MPLQMCMLPAPLLYMYTVDPKTRLLATYIELVACGGIGLQVMIRGPTAKATSQFVMFALNQVLLWRKQKYFCETVTQYLYFFGIMNSFVECVLLLTIPIWGSGTLTMSQLERTDDESSPSWMETKENPPISWHRSYSWQLHVVRAQWWWWDYLFIIDYAVLLVIWFDTRKLHHEVHKVGAALLTLQKNSFHLSFEYFIQNKHACCI